jgi:dTMP kinase
MSQVNKTKSGLYFVLEGLPRCGKSTQGKLLAEYLREKFPDREIVLTREPGGGEIAEVIRTVVQGTPFIEEMNAITEAYLYAASRAQTLRGIIEPARSRGAIIISDRSYNTSLAFQGVAKGLGIDKVWEINRIAVGDIFPDHVLLIDATAEECYRRAGLDRDVKDKHEANGFGFYQSVQDGYLQLYERDRESGQNRFHRIDGNRSIEEIHREITELVFGIIKNSV